ncbi:hypothetical protein HNR06_002418 [Nocardiopsis arvandica]|uniref:DUF3592 domain-containing protein n=1 Tax=Nocardiopsis sinuspersici TaxID=501010 RepID=A0A7Y9XC30_9ACTN|nr:DUF3592 domain-containing protein [Nocardiopsis sinuspersici]NYH52829.1 hypothetical protein [Nocardiopsis sinuspersici]
MPGSNPPPPAPDGSRRSRERSWSGTAIAVASLLLVTVLVMGGAWKMLEPEPATGLSGRAEAVVTEVRKRSGGGPMGGGTTVFVTYTVQGTTYEDVVLRERRSVPETGQTLAIAYAPGEPDRPHSVEAVESPGPGPGGRIILMVVLLPGLLLLIGLIVFPVWERFAG